MWLDIKVKWNPFIQVYLAAQIELSTAALIQFINWDLGDQSGDKAAAICSVVTLVGLLICAIYVERVITVSHEKDL